MNDEKVVERHRSPWTEALDYQQKLSAEAREVVLSVKQAREALRSFAGVDFSSRPSTTAVTVVAKPEKSMSEIIAEAAKPLFDSYRLPDWAMRPSDFLLRIIRPRSIVQVVDAADGDPDGPLVPLPKREPPPRVAPPFPASAYAAMLR